MSKKSHPGDGNYGQGVKGYHVEGAGGSLRRLLRRVASSLINIRRLRA